VLDKAFSMISLGLFLGLSAVITNATEASISRQFVTVDCNATNQHGKVVANGTAEVMAPTEKLELEITRAPETC
jgi:acyl dehydratase